MSMCVYFTLTFEQIAYVNIITHNLHIFKWKKHVGLWCHDED